MKKQTVDMVTAFVPFTVEKSDKGDGADWIIAGLASTPDQDFQGEYVVPDGINYTAYFQDNGWITYEHGHDVDDIIGEPLEAYTDEDGFHLQAKLYKESKKAQDVWSLQQALAKESSKGRSLGFSIEGPIISRDQRDPRVITGVQIRNVTVTSHPANKNAKWEAVTKSVDIGYQTNPEEMKDLGALQRNSVADAITVLTYTLDRPDCDNLLKGAQKDLDSKGMLNKKSLALILQLGRGISQERANAFVDS